MCKIAAWNTLEGVLYMVSHWCKPYYKIDSNHVCLCGSKQASVMSVEDAKKALYKMGIEGRCVDC